MNRKMKQWQALASAVCILTFIAVITVLPLRLWRESIPSTSNRMVEGVTDRLADGIYSSQMFVAQYDHLDGISIAVANENDDQDNTFILRVFDEKHGLLREQTHATSEMKKMPGECYVPLNLNTEVGKQYFYTVECIQGELFLQYEVTETSGFIYNGPCYVGEQALGGCNLVTTYHYSQPLRKGKSLLLIGLFAAIGAGVTFGLYTWNKRKGMLDNSVTLQWGIKKVCNPLVVAATVVGMIVTGPLHLFNMAYADIILHTLGVLLFSITIWYAINKPYTEVPNENVWDTVKEKVPDLLQSFCFAMGILACIHYMNGLYNIFHDIAYRELLLWMSLAVLVTFNKKEWLNLWNVVGVIAGGIWAYKYYQLHLPECMDEAGVVIDLKVQVLKLTCYAAIPIVLIALRTLVALIRGIVWFVRGMKEKRIHYPHLTGLSYFTLGYIVLTVVMAIGMIQYRNTRGWPIYTVAVFGVFALQMFLWNNRSHLLNNVMNGIIFNFVGVTYYCLLHRPFQSFLFTRYPGIFHTVTVTATYLSLVMAVALVKLFYKFNKEKNLKACFFEIIFFGIVANYELFTMSRTGLISSVVTGFVLWMMMHRGKITEKLGKMAGAIGVIILAVVWCFPIAFSAQRIIPSIVKQPDAYAEVEEFPETILVGNDLRSEDYITTDRFVEIFLNKMFNVPANTVSVLYDWRIGGLPEEMVEQNEEAEEEIIDTDARATEEGYRILPEQYASTAIQLPASLLREEEDDSQDYSNGRMDIFRAYYEDLNLWGHESMSAVLNGEELYHAHNIYLQFAFDHGIIMGILFITWLLYTVTISVIMYYKKGENSAVYALPLSIMLMFMVGGIVEWIAHPCNPVGLCVLLIGPALMMQMEKKN